MGTRKWDGSFDPCPKSSSLKRWDLAVQKWAVYPFFFSRSLQTSGRKRENDKHKYSQYFLIITGNGRSTVGSWERERIYKMHRGYRTPLVAQLVKNPPAMQETPVWFLGQNFPGEGIGYRLQYSWASLMAQTVKNPPAMQETCVRSLGWEDPLEEGMATHSIILAWRIL